MATSKDKMAVVQVIGCLLKDPTLIIDDKYRLMEDDFPERFHKIVFGAIEHLVKNGIQDLSYVAIDDFLSKYPKQYKTFTENDGCDYLLRVIDIADVKNFEYYYGTLKKFSLLNQLQQRGFDIKIVYDDSIINLEESAKIQSTFDQYTVDDIINLYDTSLLDLKEMYCTESISMGCQAAKDMLTLKEQYKQTPEMGMPLCSAKLTTIFRGRRLKKLYLKSAISGGGKSRNSVGDACCVSIPIIYDSQRKQWVNNNCKEPALIITTELEIPEVQTMIMAYVSNVPEDCILDGKYSEDEEDRVNKAIEIVGACPIYIEHIPNFNMDDIERIIKTYKVKYNIGYVFFDYIFTSIKILTEIGDKARGVKLREDNVLVMFIDRMKTLANTLNVHIDTSTQVNGDWKNVRDADQNLIRGAKGMADKIDAGYIILPPSEKDKKCIEEIMHKGFFREPNLVYHIYKVRRGKINHVKLFVYFDYATCRTYDLFVTDNDYKLLNVENTNIEIILEQTEETQIGSIVEDDKSDTKEEFYY